MDKAFNKINWWKDKPQQLRLSDIPTAANALVKYSTGMIESINKQIRGFDYLRLLLTHHLQHWPEFDKQGDTLSSNILRGEPM